MDQHVGPYVDSTHNRYRSLRLWSEWVSSSGSAIRDQGTEKERPRGGTKKQARLSPPGRARISQIPFQGDRDMTSSSLVHVLSDGCIVQRASSACFSLRCQLGGQSTRFLMVRQVLGCVQEHTHTHTHTHTQAVGELPPVAFSNPRNTGHKDTLSGNNMSHWSWGTPSRKFYETYKCGRRGEISTPHPSEI